MAANASKDQPPPYTGPDNEASTTGDIAETSTTLATKPNHTARALKLLHDTSQGRYTISQYLELTFSVMVSCNSKFEPVVLAMGEDYDELLKDIRHMFVDASKTGKMRMTREARMMVVWKDGWSYEGTSWYVKESNVTAMLRLLKSRNGVNYISIS